MPPLFLLLALSTLTLAAAAAEGAARRRRGRLYRQLAVAYGMHYSPGDPLRLTPRVAAALPVPGAAAVRVIDLLYRTDAATHLYVFTAEYTIGVVTVKRRVRRATAFTEPRGTTSPTLVIRMAPGGLPLIQQYRTLLSASDHEVNEA